MRRLLFVLSLSCAPARVAAPIAEPPVMPYPYRGREANAVSLNTTCEGCHAEQAQAWRGSMHQRAYDNDAFQAALAIEPTPFCRGCHAPEANAKAPTVATNLGVACVTCHVTADGSVLAGPGAKAAPHALTRTVSFATSASCASCHEFRFPGGSEFMQTTAREHGEMRGATTCTSCHRSHAFSEVRDPTWLASQLRVRAELVQGSRVVRLTLEQTAPGHAFPTGDLFRRLAVRVGDETRYLARHFEGSPKHAGRTLVRDDRIFDEPRVLEFPLPPGAPEVTWSVTLERVAAIGTGAEPARAAVESKVSLHSGVLGVKN